MIQTKSENELTSLMPSINLIVSEIKYEIQRFDSLIYENMQQTEEKNAEAYFNVFYII